MKEIAEQLHLSYNQARDCWKKCVIGDVFNESALVNKRLGAGSSQEPLEVHQEEINWLCSDTTLCQMAGLSLVERTASFNLKWSRSITTAELRKLFRASGITQQKMRWYLGPSKPKPFEE
jgi:hypothetical protein